MKTFSKSWKGSVKARKQRKYRANMPLHMRRKLVEVTLSKELREKHKRRNISVRKGDKVKVVRGQFKKKEGKVDVVDRKNAKLLITGIEFVKKDGSKVLPMVHATNVTITELNLDDKRRKTKVEGATK
jgi:large subunit ribosomal protein L24